MRWARFWARVVVRSGIIAVRSPQRSAWAGVGTAGRSPVGAHKRGEQQRAARGGDIGVPVGKAPNDRAVGQLLVVPAPKRFHQMMQPAQAFQVRRVRGTALGVGDGVVDIAVGGRAVTARGPTGQVPAAHELGQFGRRGVAGLGTRRWAQRGQPGRPGQLGDQLGRDQALDPGQHPGRGPAALDGGLLGDHVDHHIALGRRRARRGALGTAAAAHQPVGPGGQRPQRIGAPLLAACGDRPSHTVAANSSSRRSRAGRRCPHLALHPGHPRRVGHDIHIPVLGRLGGPAHRIGIHRRPPPGRPRRPARPGQRRAPRHQHRQPRIHLRQHRRVR